MTNYDAIKAMDKDKLVELLFSFTSCGDCPVSKERCKYTETCAAAINDWLNEEADDDTVVAHSDGKTIHISHANVVIID